MDEGGRGLDAFRPMTNVWPKVSNPFQLLEPCGYSPTYDDLVRELKMRSLQVIHLRVRRSAF